jgi:NADH:ubiquinone oxidoreductase subunit E
MTQDLELEKPELEDVSAAMWERIDAVIAAESGRPGATIPVLRKCQDTVGYLPRPLIAYVAAGLGLPRAEVFGVATFYSLFTLAPRGRHCIKACEGTACYVRGIKEVIGRIRDTHGVGIGETTEDRRFSLESVRCIGACGLAPVVVVDQDTHGSMTPEKIVRVLEQYT